MPAHFDASAFLRDRWGDPPRLRSFLANYGHDVEWATINQWFRRGRIPPDWLATLLSLSELEAGAPLSIAKYLA
jgi:hypothetical protein